MFTLNHIKTDYPSLISAVLNLLEKMRGVPTIQTYLYDPRPGYPFNFWARNEMDKLKYLLLKYSSIYAEYEKKQ